MAFELRIPGRVTPIRPPLETHCFNGGLVVAWDRLLTVYRVNRRPSMLAVSELDPATLQPVSTRLLWDCCDPLLIPEDPRAIARGDNLYLMWVGVHSVEMDRAMMVEAELDADYRLVWKRPCNYSGADRCEKNWVPFLQDGALHCVYGYDPHTILRCGDRGWRLIHAREVDWGWSYGEVHGSTPPVWHNGRWYCFFHSARIESNVKVYYVGCYTMARDFSVEAVTARPIMAGGTHAFVEPHDLPWRPGSRVSAVFPCGALVLGDEWLVSYGFFDAELRVARISVDALDAALGLAPDRAGANGRMRIRDYCPLVRVGQ